DRLNDLELVIALARACELQGDADTCVKLLAPHAALLGSGEGARLLGVACVQMEFYDQAYLSLRAYCAVHFEPAMKLLQATSSDNRGRDWEIERAWRVLAAATQLARVHHHRGQHLPDAAARRAELAEAEKMLLALKALPGTGNLYLAQVYVWMGKPDEAEKLFETFLSEANRIPRALYLVAEAQRGLGNIAKARKLAEEGFAGVSDDGFRRVLGMFR